MTLTTTFQKIATGGTQVFGAARGYLELYAKYNSQDKVNNTTNYEVKCMLVVTGGYIGDYQSTTLTMSATGLTTTKTSKGTGNFVSTTLGTIKGTVSHNNNGTKSITASSSMNFAGWGQTLTVSSGSISLPTIPRNSTISATDSQNDGTSIITIKLADPSLKYVHTVNYKFGSLTGTIVTKTNLLTIPFEIPSTFLSELVNTTEKNCELTCTTYNTSGTQIGSTSKTTFRVYIDVQNSYPILTNMLLNDTNENVTAITNSTTDNPVLVSDKSTPLITGTIQSNNGSHITKIFINDVEVFSQTADDVALNINPGIYPSYIVKVVDTRGLMSYYTFGSDTTQTYNKTFTYINYQPTSFLQITSTLIQDFQDTRNLKFNGIWYNGNIGATPNTLALSWDYAQFTGNTQYESYTYTTGGTFTKDTDYKVVGNSFYSGKAESNNFIEWTNQLAYDLPWVIKFTATDIFGPNVTYVLVPTGAPIYWWDSKRLYYGGTNDHILGFQRDASTDLQYKVRVMDDVKDTTKGIISDSIVHNFKLDDTSEYQGLNDILNTGILIDCGIGRYNMWAKWSNGFMICTGIRDDGTITWTKDGDLWVSRNRPLDDFPQKFASTPISCSKTIQSMGPSGRTVIMGGTSSPTTTNPGTYNLATYWNATDTHVTISYVALGFWK